MCIRDRDRRAQDRPTPASERRPTPVRGTVSALGRCEVWTTVCGVGVPALRRDGNEAWRGACPVYGCTAVALSARLDDAGASLPVCSHWLYLVQLMRAVCACGIPCRNLPRELAAGTLKVGILNYILGLQALLHTLYRKTITCCSRRAFGLHRTLQENDYMVLTSLCNGHYMPCSGYSSITIG